MPFRSRIPYLFGSLVTIGTLSSRFSYSLHCEETPTPPKKPHMIVLLGTGWGSVSLLKAIQAKGGLPPGVELNVISPRGYFLYSPLLPAAAAGTIETRSIVEPVRSFLPPGTSFIEAEALSIDPHGRVVQCKSRLVGGSGGHFHVPYDTLIVATGAVNTTFGTPGVREHGFFLKTAEDVIRLRTRIHDSIELASLPTTPPEDRARLLSIVVCGGGPTGSELAAELNDLIQEDLKRLYPHLAGELSVTVVDSNCHVLCECGGGAEWRRPPVALWEWQLFDMALTTPPPPPLFPPLTPPSQPCLTVRLPPTPRASSRRMA